MFKDRKRKKEQDKKREQMRTDDLRWSFHVDFYSKDPPCAAKSRGHHPALAAHSQSRKKVCSN